MTRSTITAIAVAILLAFSCAAMANTLSKAEYKSAKAACESLVANEKDICMVEAKGKKSVALSELNVTNRSTRKSRYEAQIAKDDAEHNVATERCDDKAGNAKDICLKQADAVHTAAKADAKAQMKTSAAKNTANKKSAEAPDQANEEISDAHKDAKTEKRDADYAVALEKCDALAGSPKDVCVNKAKADHGKS